MGSLRGVDGVDGIGTGAAGSLGYMDKVQRTEAEWREQLTPEEYQVLRQAGTEAPWTGEYTDTKTEGVYRCRACGAELFRSKAEVRVPLRVAELLPADRATTPWC